MQVIRKSEADIKAQKRQLLGIDFFFESVRTEALVCKFVDKLRKNIKEKKEFLKKQEKSKLESVFLTVDPNEHVDIEINCIHYTDELIYTIIKIPKVAKHDDPVKYLRKVIKSGIKFTKGVFYFSENCLEWKKKIHDKNVEGRLFIAGISDIKIYEPKKSRQRFLLFVIGNMIYVFTFTNTETMKKWGKSIVYNKDLAIQEFKPTEFEQFIACLKDQVFDEIFEEEDQDYTYQSIKILCEAKRVEREKRKKYEKAGMENDP